MYQYLICCKLTFDLQNNNKLHILNIHYYKFIFIISLNFILKLSLNIYMHKKICIIHNHSFIQIEITRNVMINEVLLQFKVTIPISCV
jgi:hypothetical protein